MITNVDKGWLLKVLRSNREKHQAEFEKAWKSFETKAIEQMQMNLQAAKTRKAVRLFIQMAEPRNETSSYDRVIGMLNETTNDLIELTEKDWQKYVQDEWDWTDQFKTTNSAYLGDQ